MPFIIFGVEYFWKFLQFFIVLWLNNSILTFGTKTTFFVSTRHLGSSRHSRRLEIWFRLEISCRVVFLCQPEISCRMKIFCRLDILCRNQIFSRLDILSRNKILSHFNAKMSRFFRTQIKKNGNLDDSEIRLLLSVQMRKS